MASSLKSFWFFIFCVITSIQWREIPHIVDARRAHLIEDDGPRRTHRPAECQFGKQLKELGSSWFPDLGPPFGVMYCFRCECVAVQKKRRIVAKVECRSMKYDCPKVTCDDPVILPGKCCKTCPGDNTSIIQDVPPPTTANEDERNIKEFGTLLTARTSQILKREEMKSMYSINNPQNIVATGRFSLHKKNLYYSFYVSEKATRPRAIQFMDATGNILEEHNLTIPANEHFSIYQNTTGKLCGVWRRVPRDYRKLLKDDQIIVAILWGDKYQAELALAGRIEKYPALQTEILSSLLEPAPGTSPEQMAGAGGTAIVSAVGGTASSVHITLVVNGVFNPDEILDVPLNIRLEAHDKKQIILEDIQKVKKPAHAVNVIEISSPVSTSDLRMLARGKLFVTVESRRNPESLRLQGQVVSRVSCEIFQTVISSHNPDSQQRTNGLAWIYLNRDGGLVYNLEVNDLNYDANPLVALVDDSGKRRLELEDLTPTLNKVTNIASGTIDRLGPRVLEPLYSGDLSVNILSIPDTTIARGRLVSRPVADARDSPAPILFKKIDDFSPPNVAGMAWVAVDSACELHYDLMLTGLHSYRQLELYLEEKAIEAPGATVTRTFLEEFNGNYLEGFSLEIPEWQLAKLETSVCYLEVFSKEFLRPLLRAKLKSVKVPIRCSPNDSDNELPIIASTMNDVGHPAYHALDTKCYSSGQFYEEGEQWQDKQRACTMCSCVNRRVKCEAIKCPPLRCKQDDVRERKGECCPFCMDSKTFEEVSHLKVDRGCQLGSQFYQAGYSWHPYLPPSGFDTCAICTCDPVSLKITCPKVQCPSLQCSEKDAYRPDKKSCCKKCPEIRVETYRDKTHPDLLKDQGFTPNKTASTQEIMANGGCIHSTTVYENGQEWHPIISSYGEHKCVDCRCKDGSIQCSKKRCTRSVCNNRILGRNKNKDKNNIDECCSTQCHRFRNHNHNARRMRRERIREHHHQHAKS
uniref:Putative conserved secreted protein n=1 Tax=Phlebotomus kandelakii TaxID=1109342 RepID=A0A6B2E6G5_9DIPT